MMYTFKVNKEEIIRKVKELDLSEGSYVVFGGAPMAMVGLRPANDIELLVSPEVLAKLKEAGWQQIYKNPGDTPVVDDVFEVHNNWNFSPYSPTLQHLLASATIIDDIPFASLQEVRKWKLASGRPKDITDIKLIDKYLST